MCSFIKRSDLLLKGESLKSSTKERVSLSWTSLKSEPMNSSSLTLKYANTSCTYFTWNRILRAKKKSWSPLHSTSTTLTNRIWSTPTWIPLRKDLTPFHRACEYNSFFYLYFNTLTPSITLGLPIRRKIFA